MHFVFAPNPIKDYDTKVYSRFMWYRQTFTSVCQCVGLMCPTAKYSSNTYSPVEQGEKTGSEISLSAQRELKRDSGSKKQRLYLCSPLSPAQHEVQDSRLHYHFPWSGSRGNGTSVFSVHSSSSLPPLPLTLFHCSIMDCSPSRTCLYGIFSPFLIQVFPKVPPPWLQGPVMPCGGATGAGWNGLCPATPHRGPYSMWAPAPGTVKKTRIYIY